MTAEVIDVEATELEPRPARIDVGMAATGALALAALSDDEFERRLTAMEKGLGRVEKIQKALMTLDVDYGVIPGTRKPTLYKPGAEMLCQAYSLAADFEPVRTIGDGIEAPSISYLMRCSLHLGSLDGPVIGVGYGACNSWETRYRYRRGERVCPNCGKPAIIKGKEEYGGGWVCFKKKDGCGSKWRDGAPEIEGQSVGDVENPDPFDLDVVLAKMAEKRAHVDATLRATNASRLFTQDVEDLARPPDPDSSTVDRETGEIRQVGEQTERLLGETTRTGTIEKGDGAGSDLQAHVVPDGHHIGFALKTSKGRIAQVWAIEDIAAGLMVATGDEPSKLAKEKATCTGLVYDVSQPGRTTFQRMKLSKIVVLDLILPYVEEVAATSAPVESERPATGESGPLGPVVDEDLDAATDALWPAGAEA